MGIPGVHVNAFVADGCLRDSLRNKKYSYVAIIDLSKAFDTISHWHIKRMLSTLPILNSI